MKTKLNSIYQSIYEIFGKVVINEELPKANYNELVKVGLLKGKFVPVTANYQWLYEYLRDVCNLNSTFYHSFEKVASQSRLDLYIDQIIHYASTYGTNFTGEAWLPERTVDLPDFKYSELTAIETISLDDFEGKYFELLYSNIAFKSDTIESLMDIGTLFGFIDKIVATKIKNRELKYIIRYKFDIHDFSDGQDCLMQMLYDAYSITLLIKNKDTYDQIAQKHLPTTNDILLQYLVNDADLLSSVFLRNKDLFLNIKSLGNYEVSHAINRLRKLAKKNHKPLEPALWLRLGTLSESERKGLYAKESLFKLTQVYNAITKHLNSDDSLYLIRNGKGFFKASEHKTKPIPSINLQLAIEIAEVIINRLHKAYEGKTIKLPVNIELAVPTSEKNFIGEIPIGSSVELGASTMIGIYWRNEWGAHDLDLHAYTFDGESIGWNTSYYDGVNIVFSGDMTNADPEATEVMLFTKEVSDCIIKNCLFRGSKDTKFKFFIAKEDDWKNHFSRNYMVDPRKIVYETMSEFTGSREITLGFIANSKFIFSKMNTGNVRFPVYSENSKKLIRYMVNTEAYILKVNEVLEKIGAKLVTDPSEECDYDLSKFTKNDLIAFFNI